MLLQQGQSIRFLRDIGIPHKIQVSAGTYEGELNLNTQLSIPNQPPQVVEAIAKVLVMQLYKTQ